MRWREVNQKRKEHAPYRDKVYLIKLWSSILAFIRSRLEKVRGEAQA